MGDSDYGSVRAPSNPAEVSAGANQRVADLWSDFAERRAVALKRVFVTDHPRFRQKVYDTYLAGLDPMNWVRARRMTRVPARQGLEIGCGSGDLAIAVVETGLCEALDAFDVAAGALTLAADKAAAKGLTSINFFAADANSVTLPEKRYDFVYASHSLHHIENLEGLFSQVARLLTPDGIFFAHDYIGPSRMQYEDSHLALMNEALASLPPEKRLSILHGGTERPPITRTPIEAFLEIDPSEGVRAAEIVPVMRRFFDVEVIPTGLSIAYEVLLGIVHNFVDDDPMDDALIDFIFAFDRLCGSVGLTPCCFAGLVARPPRPGWRSRLRPRRR